MSNLYETLILAVPEITNDEAQSLEEQIDQIIKKNTGAMKSFERWGKYRLSYPVRKNEYGVYFLTRFEVAQEQATKLMSDLHNFFTVKLPQVVMRYMNTKLDPEKPLTYQKPESLEDISSRDVDLFLKENNMNGLIKSKVSFDTRPKRQEGDVVVELEEKNDQERDAEEDTL